MLTCDEQQLAVQDFYQRSNRLPSFMSASLSRSFCSISRQECKIFSLKLFASTTVSSDTTCIWDLTISAASALFRNEEANNCIPRRCSSLLESAAACSYLS